MDPIEQRVEEIEQKFFKFAARYSAMEFIFEVIVANAVAGMPEDAADHLLTDIQSPYRPVVSRNEVPESEVKRAQTDAVWGEVEHYAEKIRKRSKQVREQLRGQVDPTGALRWILHNPCLMLEHLP